MGGKRVTFPKIAVTEERVGDLHYFYNSMQFQNELKFPDS